MCNLETKTASFLHLQSVVKKCVEEIVDQSVVQSEVNDCLREKECLEDKLISSCNSTLHFFHANYAMNLAGKAIEHNRNKSPDTVINQLNSVIKKSTKKLPVNKQKAALAELNDHTRKLIIQSNEILNLDLKISQFK